MDETDRPDLSTAPEGIEAQRFLIEGEAPLESDGGQGQPRAGMEVSVLEAKRSQPLPHRSLESFCTGPRLQGDLHGTQPELHLAQAGNQEGRHGVIIVP